MTSWVPGFVGIRCVMALIRGVKCLFPCPRCMISQEKQGDISVNAPPRTAAGTKATIQEARKQKRVGDKEAILKASGLRDVDVCLYFIFLVSYHS